MNQDYQKKIFISFSHSDKELAMRIKNRLSEANFTNIWTDDNIELGDNFYNSLKYSVESSDIILLLLSKNSIHSQFFEYNSFEPFANQIKKRKIILYPILIGKCNIPSDLLSYEIFDLTKDFESGINKLIQRIRIIPEINFEHFNYRQFEELVYDLLKEYRFKNIQREFRNDFSTFDFLAEYINTTPFGTKYIEKWIIETKFYSHSRIDINLVNQLRSYLTHNKEFSKSILITNSNLTSVVEEYIEDLKKDFNYEIIVIDGAQLKKLIARRKRLLKKYFPITGGIDESN